MIHTDNEVDIPGLCTHYYPSQIDRRLDSCVEGKYSMGWLYGLLLLFYYYSCLFQVLAKHRPGIRRSTLSGVWRIPSPHSDVKSLTQTSLIRRSGAPTFLSVSCHMVYAIQSGFGS